MKCRTEQPSARRGRAHPTRVVLTCPCPAGQTGMDPASVCSLAGKTDNRARERARRGDLQAECSATGHVRNPWDPKAQPLPCPLQTSRTRGSGSAARTAESLNGPQASSLCKHTREARFPVTKELFVTKKPRHFCGLCFQSVTSLTSFSSGS